MKIVALLRTKDCRLWDTKEEAQAFFDKFVPPMPDCEIVEVIKRGLVGTKYGIYMQGKLFDERETSTL